MILLSKEQIPPHILVLVCMIILHYNEKSLKLLFLIFDFPTQITKRLSNHPCVITVQEMGAARHFLRTTLADKSQEERLRLLQPTLEINPR